MALTVGPRALMVGGSVSSVVGFERLLNSWMRQDATIAQFAFAIGVLFAIGGVLMVGAAVFLVRIRGGQW